MRGFDKTRVSYIDPLIAPTGGIDDTSPIANMDEKYALKMVNMFPESGSLRVRDGYRAHCTNIASPPKTLIKYLAGDDFEDRLFACTDDGIYDVSTSMDGPPKVADLTNGDVQWTNFSNIAGHYLLVCNGVDAAMIYDGDDWTPFTELDPGDPITGIGQLIGLDPTTIVDIHPHGNRLWFAVRYSSAAYHMEDVSQLSGAVMPFPLRLAQGGAINTIFTWTMDLGESASDLIVFQTTQGELHAYDGVDPITPGAFTLAARYAIGRPLGRKSVVPYNGDCLMMTDYGLVSFSALVAGRHSAGNTEGTASGRISRTLNKLVRSRINSEGWEVVAAPSFQYIILSIPEYSGQQPYQYVMNSLTGAWTTFDLPAESFIEYKGMVYFGDSAGTVFRHGDSDLDNVDIAGTGGRSIVSGFQQAYSYFKTPNVPKHYKLIRPVFESPQTPQFALNISTDFSITGGFDDLPEPADVERVGVFWDEALWDEAIWSTNNSVYQEWEGLAGVGYCASLAIRISSTIETRYVASNWAIEGGTSL